MTLTYSNQPFKLAINLVPGDVTYVIAGSYCRTGFWLVTAVKVSSTLTTVTYYRSDNSTLTLDYYNTDKIRVI